MTHRSLAGLLLSASLLAQAQPDTSARFDVADLIEHYRRVEGELRAAPAPVDPARAEARRKVIDLLRDYRLLADFGRSDRFPGERIPCFVDDDGRRCAVAFLLDRTGHGELTAAVARHQNHAFVAELGGHPELLAWLDAHGLSLADAARIQGPPRNTRNQRGNEPPPPPPPPPPRWDGPDDGSRPGAGRSPTRDAAADARARDGRATTAAAARTADRRQPGATPVVNLEAEHWHAFWDWNARAFLPPQPVRLPAAALPHTFPPPVATPPIRAALERGLTDPQPQVRRAAVLAHGRAGGDVSLLRARLLDSHQEVRIAAVLALGAQGSAEARHLLLHLAVGTGPLGTQNLHAYALLALAVDPAPQGRPDADAVASAGLHDGNAAAQGALTFGLGGDSPRLRERSRTLLAGRGNTVLRARAAEALGADADAASVQDLTKALATRALDVRRSAALALGRSRHPLALPALMTAFELERELLARAFLLVAIGEHGGPAAGPFLSEQVEFGRRPLRAWAALGLGLWGRERDDAAARALVRQMAGKESNRDLAGAWLLAMGLLRDRDALPVLAQAMREESSTTRSAALQALGLLGQAGANELVRAALAADDCTFVRGTAAEVLGAVAREAEDLRALELAARTDLNPAVRGSAAAAIGLVGSWEAHARLLALCTADDPPLRAGALRGLGLLSRRHEPVAPQLTRMANYTLFPDWLGWALSQDL